MSSQMTILQGQCFVDHHAGGLMEGICSLHGISRCHTEPTGHGQMCLGTPQDQPLNRTPCCFSPTVWIGLEALGSAALLMWNDQVVRCASMFGRLVQPIHHFFQMTKRTSIHAWKK